MDRQKTIPPLSQKITRKLASESADHHHVMNFYSQISRDESGAPKKWKMSNPVQITDQMIPVTASTSGSRERKNRTGEKKPLALLKKRAASKDSPDRNSSRDSSVESNRSSKENKGRRSMSADTANKTDNKAENHVENGVKPDNDAIKKRSRPRSLDLSTKPMTNGDEDNFRSPHPLTPCNVAVKRRKGRPKETPPTLVAESPVEPMTDDAEMSETVNDTESEQPTVVRRKPGRKPNPNKLVKTKKLANQFAIKKYERAVKNYGSKIIKKRIFKKIPPLTTAAKDINLMLESDNVVTASKTVEKDKKEADLLSPRRKPGRPPGAKNKPKLPGLEQVSPSTEQVSPIISPEKKKAGRPPGAKNRSLFGIKKKKKTKSELKNVAKEDANKSKSELKNVVKEDANKSKSELKTMAKEDANKSKSELRNMAKEDANKSKSELKNMAKEDANKSVLSEDNQAKNNEKADDIDTKHSDMQSQVVKLNESEWKTVDIIIPSRIPETVGDVLFKTDDQTLSKMQVKKHNTLRTAHFKDKKGVKSLGKLKKESTSVPRVKKKRVLISHATNTDCIASLAHLPVNDLRRKLHRKLLEKLNGKRPKNSISADAVTDHSESDVNLPASSENLDINIESDKNIDSETVIAQTEVQTEENIEEDAVISSDEKDITEDIQNLSALVEQKRVNKLEPVIAVEQKKKSMRPRKSNSEQRELSKFSDSESVCSELSTQSLGSFKRSVEKQILILGEDNADSDENTVRTRQRFEIIPGKKRKRTLSGEFDLLDEKQLRKQRKKVELGGDASAEESDTMPDVEIKMTSKKKSPRKVSPKVKLKKDLLARSLGRSSPYMPSYRAKLLRESPFLGKTKKRRHIGIRNRLLSNSVSDSELGEYGIDTNEVVKTDMKPEKLVTKEAIQSEIISEIKEKESEQETDMDTQENEPSLFRKERSLSLDDSIALESDGVLEFCSKETTCEETKETTCEETKETTCEEIKETTSEETTNKETVSDSVIDKEVLESESSASTEIVKSESNTCTDVLESESSACKEVLKSELSADTEILKSESSTCAEALKSESSNSAEVLKSESSNSAEVLKSESSNSAEVLKSESSTCAEVLTSESSNSAKVLTSESSSCEEVLKSKSSACESTAEELVKAVDFDCQSEIKSLLLELIDTVVGEEPKNSVELQNFTNPDIKKSDSVRDKIIELEENHITTLESKPDSETAEIIQSTETVLLDYNKLHSTEMTRTPLSTRGGRVRRRRGRRPYKHLLLNNRQTHATVGARAGRQRKVRVRKAFQDQPELGSATHKFELRQKISRSPLDNIALKQSIEESEYYKIEAQKAVRKELKKAKRSPQSQESAPIPTIETETEIPESREEDSSESVHEMEENMTEILLRECRPCSVTLTDFIKQLQLAGRRVASDEETENDTEESMSDVDRQSGPSPIPNQERDESIGFELADQMSADKKEVVASAQPDNSLVNAVSQDSITDIGTDENKVTNTDNNTRKFEDSYVEMSTKTNIDTVKPRALSSNDKMVMEDVGKSGKEGNKTVHSGDMKPTKSASPTKKSNADNKTKTSAKTFQPKTSPVKVMPTPTTNIALTQSPGPKSRRTSRKSIQSGAGRGRKPQSSTIPEIHEPQTARKTVPPLKIKVKGGPRSRRKTYMVETIIDDQANFKVVKKRSKSKSGNRSESEADKLASSHHHHHKRKSKSPSVESFLNKKNKNLQPAPSKETVKKPLKPNEAYEATFLQFIQNHKTEPPSIYRGSKGKPLHQIPESKAYKVQADGSLTVTASSLTETTTSTNIEKVVTSAKTNINTKEQNSVVKLGDKDVQELQFVCSYCDKMVFREKEYIIKHIREMHPGEDVIFRELPYVIAENHIEYVNKNEKLVHENIFDRMKEVLPQEKDILEKKLPDKTSAEADSTTEVEAAHTGSGPTGLEEKKRVVQSRPDDDVCDADDEDSGSLNLKIVDVVSLKDQVGLLDSDVPVPQSQVKTLSPNNPINTLNKSTELKIPHYPRTNKSVSMQQQISHEKQVFDSVKKPLPPRSGQSEKKGSSGSGKVSSTFKCDKCNVHAPLLAAMVAHLRNAHKDIPRLFQCPYCRDMEAESEAKIHNHIRQLHPTDNPNPPVALSESAKRNLRTVQVHLPDSMKLSDSNTLEKDVYMCLKCKLHKPSLETIYEHLENEHSEVFVYVCPFCKVFKSKMEDVVNKHLVHAHQKPYNDVNLSLAIDGNQFSRVTCLIKEKSRGQKTSTNTAQQPKPQHHSTSLTHHTPILPAHQSSPILAKSPVAALYQRLLQPQVSANNPSPFHPLAIPQPVPTTKSSNIQPGAAHQTQPKPSPPAKPPTAPAPKRKKNLLESIEQLTLQKQREQQGLLSSGSKPTTQASSVSGTSSTDTSAASSVSSLPPPLIRGPPPLIRFDQLGKPPPYSVAMASLTSRSSTHSSPTNLLNHLQSSKTLQSLAQIPPRPIQSSLFDTSDPETFKTVKRGPVLNVPVVSRSKSSSVTKSPSPHTQTSGLGTVPLDLSKSTPSPSPQPQHMQTPPPAPLQSDTSSKPKTITPEGFNPDMFKVFNLKPTASQPLQMVRPSVPLMQASLAQLAPAQHVMPQQVRPNTSNTLAYRPPIPHVNAAAQIPQIINMGAVIGNIMVPITSLPQGFQAVQGMGQLSGVPTQLVQMNPAQPLVPQTLPVNTTVSSSPVSVPSKSGSGLSMAPPTAQLANLNLPMFKCPYCPKVIPLTLAQVQPHIESLHPGSSIVFTQLENK